MSTTKKSVIRIATTTLGAAAALTVAPFAVSMASADSGHAACPPASQSHQCHHVPAPVPNVGGTTSEEKPTVPDPIDVATTYGPTIAGGDAPVNLVGTVGSTVGNSPSQLAVPQPTPNPVPTAIPTVPDPIYVATSYGPTITGGYAPVGPVGTTVGNSPSQPAVPQLTVP